ncbi:MAG: sigma-70 family RNA polymerase sigma factor [Actinomycetota bacterium]|nr:sigma-70 family RNA polymerase sigma factor [Actinomycetota bacterium]
MGEPEWLSTQFETNRGHLQAVAYRMLGSASDADDAVQEAWLRLHRSDTGGIQNLGGWLTTVVARVSLDMLRSRRTRREDPLDHLLEVPSTSDADADPEQAAVLADAVGPALLVVMDTLQPTERLAFVLHDLFGVPFEEIAGIVDRSPAAVRQLASRARRRVQGVAPDPAPDVSRRRQVVDAFLAAARGGDFEALLVLLDPDATLHADQMAAQAGAPAELRGARAVAAMLSGRAKAARPALIDRVPGAVWAPGGTPRVVFAFTITGGRVARIDMLSDPQRLARMDIEIL